MEKGRLDKGFDIIGDIAIVKFDGKLSKKQKLLAVKNILSKNKNVKRIIEKTGMTHGEERIPKLKQLIGKGSTALHKENGCRFYVDVNDFVNKLLKNPKRLPNKKLDYELEMKVFTESKSKLKEMYNAEIKIEESNEDRAFPGKPMLVIK